MNSIDGNLPVSDNIPVGSPLSSCSMVTLESGDWVLRSIPAICNARLLAMPTDGGTFQGVQAPRMYTGFSGDTLSRSHRLGKRPS